MNIEDITIRQFRELSALFGASESDASPCPYKVGECYIFRCVTFHSVGRVKAVVGSTLVLEDSSWVADSGKYGDALRTGNLKELEFVGDNFVERGSIVDAQPWTHALPTESK